MAAPPAHRQVDGSGRRARNRQGSRKGSPFPGERYLPISHCPNEPSSRSRLGSKCLEVLGNRARSSPHAPHGWGFIPSVWNCGFFEESFRSFADVERRPIIALAFRPPIRSTGSDGRPHTIVSNFELSRTPTCDFEGCLSSALEHTTHRRSP